MLRGYYRVSISCS